ncbi:MAG: hypothetical protein WDN04_24270 [Rhodospirillales bacterium]
MPAEGIATPAWVLARDDADVERAARDAALSAVRQALQQLFQRRPVAPFAGDVACGFCVCRRKKSCAATAWR